jgi:hypothetical protein
VPLVPDFMAPTNVTGKISRPGRSNTYTTFHQTFYQCGNSGGLSTLQLSTKRPSVFIDSNTMDINSFTLNHRHDIAHYVDNDDHFQKGFLEQHRQHLEQNPIPDDVIRKTC